MRPGSCPGWCAPGGVIPQTADLAPVPSRCEHVFAMIVCVVLPRFPLVVAAGGREALASGPVALAPEPGREPVIGEVSAAAEANRVRPGLRLRGAAARRPAPPPPPPPPTRRGRPGGGRPPPAWV